MDSLTHLAAGALTPLVFSKTPIRAAVIGFGIAAGSLPDMDFIFGVSPEARLVLHRGVTHALFWQPVFVLLAVLPFYIWMHCKKNGTPPGCHGSLSIERAGIDTGVMASDGCIGFFTMYCMALAAGFMHIFLDGMTTFGTQILLPFSDFRAGLPAMYIVDPFLTVPLLALLTMALRQPPAIVPYSVDGSRGKIDAGRGVAVVSPKTRQLAAAGIVWALLYPLAVLGINNIAARSLSADLAPGETLVLLPEPFAPVFLKGVIDEGAAYRVGTVNLFTLDSKTIREHYPKVDPALYDGLKRQMPLFGIFEKFCSLMAQEERPVSYATQASYARPVREYAFVDMRYILSRESPGRLIGLGEAYFVLEARVNDTGALVAYRFLLRGEGDRDSVWIEL